MENAILVFIGMGLGGLICSLCGIAFTHRAGTTEEDDKVSMAAFKCSCVITVLALIAFFVF